MADFVTVAFHASQTLGGPHRLARRLGVQPDDLYRWIAGLDLPAEGLRVDLQRRISRVLVVAPAAGSAGRRHGDHTLSN
jgi:DNA-binding transcriptional regulator YdaS (Cro superfamily)